MHWLDKVKDIGTLCSEVMVFGGVYSNLQALEALHEIAGEKEIPASNIICTGDMVGYCAQPVEVLDFIRNWGIHAILGNVEIQLKEGEEDCGCNFNDGSRCDLFSRQWYPFAQSQVRSEQIEWLRELPEFIRFQFAGKSCFVLHGGLENTSEYIFESTPDERKRAILDQTQSDIILAGHCGLPFNSPVEDKLWLNPGVIGMPANDGTPRVWYMLLNDRNGFSFQHQSFTYNHDLANQLMLEKGLPKTYAATLKSGIWDNCEILPEVEAGRQGRVMKFDD
ncbi:metallophosphoesterase family protein [Roseivirga sp. UBA1976]|uniref:metallophosphoesterase family protein n=1 Tax=Roseivirga sp. UBA1976 TaxID=1947386 RepID=UPI00257E7018|nr:metallophosphoesterase family protein [Roseivirga sp. UBA1976]|tara:strand:- start:1670 stop:2506 length:837 start_codon:yes stop_codon:yes gene_type:complete